MSRTVTDQRSSSINRVEYMKNNYECAWQRVGIQDMLLIKYNKYGQTNTENRGEVSISRFYTLLIH